MKFVMKNVKYISVLLFVLFIGKRCTNANTNFVDLNGDKVIKLLSNTFLKSSEIPINGSKKLAVVKRGKPFTMHFRLRKDGARLSIFIHNECSKYLRWNFYLIESKNSYETWKPIEIYKSKLSSGEVKSYIHVSGFNVQGIPVMLAKYNLERPQLFKLDSAPKGLYIITINGYSSVEQHAKVSVLHGGIMRSEFPVLPLDKQVVVAKGKDGLIKLYWQPAKLVVSNMQSQTGEQARYCLSVNIRKHLHQLCEVSRMLQTRPKDMLKFICFDKQHSIEIEEPSQSKFYVDLFAVNPFSNRSSNYQGLTLSPSLATDFIQLKESQTLQLEIRQSQKYQLIRFDINFVRLSRFSFIVCNGVATIIITRENTVIKKLDVRDFRTWLMRNPLIGTYFISITSKSSDNLQLRVYFSTKSRRQPFPKIPRGRNIREWPMLRTCHSVTMAWIGGHHKQQYCIYAGKDTKRTKHIMHNICYKPSNDKEMHKLMCIHKRGLRHQASVFVKTFKKLKPCTSYLFIIQVKKRRSSESLIYQPVRIKTPCKNC